MFSLLGIVSIINTCIQGIKDACTPTIPAENWANKDLYYEDMMKGVSTKERLKNVQNGKYKLTEKYPEPHRDPKDGKIIIENYELYKKDVMEHSVQQAYKWLHQGKYNLTPEELEKYKEELKKKWEHLRNVL